MKRIISLTVILCFALLALTLTATAQGPGLINYQGYLTDDQGDPVSGDYTMTFKIHDDPTGPNVIWEEPSQVVTVTEGLFEVILGEGISITDEVFSGDGRWLQITVEGEDITPRTRLTTAPYAFRVGTVDGASGGSVSGDLNVAKYNGVNLTLTSWGYIEDSPTAWIDFYSGLGYPTHRARIGVAPWDWTLHINPAPITNDVTLVTGGGNVAIGHDAPAARLDVAGDLKVRDETTDILTFAIDARENDSYGGAAMSLCTATGLKTIQFDADKGGGLAIISLNNNAGARTISLWADEGDGGSSINMYNSAGARTIKFDADVYGVGIIGTDVLNIYGGSDLSERFEIREEPTDIKPTPGMVVCINEKRPGELKISTEAYDRTVAGIISGAGGVMPGLLMGQKGSVADGEYPVALTGRVWCLADASYGPIQPGDLLTTSNTPGHAMKALDRERMYGAVIGKAMTSLESGQGLVLVLVNLQ